nr:hypothetical protein [Tanacetum cinerariifolium]
MSRYYPSKDKENTTGRISQVRDIDSGEKFKTSTLGEIVSLEKSIKNVIDQLRERDETVRNLQSKINISKMLNLGSNDDSTASSVNVQALETELCQLKDTITSLRIENDALKPANPNVIAPRMYVVSPKYIVPHRRDNRETPIPVPKKKHVTFREPQSTTRITLKPDTAIKQPNNHVDSSLKRSVSVKNAGCDVCHICLNFDSYDNHVFNSMNSGTRNHSKAKSSVSTTKTVRKPNVVTPKKPVWKPTGRHFTLYASSPLTRILKPIDEPVELTLSVSSNANLTIESSLSSLAVIQQLRFI